MKSLKRAVDVLYALSTDTVLDEGFGLALFLLQQQILQPSPSYLSWGFSPLPCAYPCDIKNTDVGYERLLNLCGSIENLLSRLYLHLTPRYGLDGYYRGDHGGIALYPRFGNAEAKRGQLSELALANVVSHLTLRREILPEKPRRGSDIEAML